MKINMDKIYALMTSADFNTLHHIANSNAIKMVED